jgi:putative glutathione S-transferase
MTARLDEQDGWLFKLGEDDSMEADPLYGYTCMRQLYEHAESGYTGKYTVPLLFDKKKETIVNNESSEIIRMFYTEVSTPYDWHIRNAVLMLISVRRAPAGTSSRRK